MNFIIHNGHNFVIEKFDVWFKCLDCNKRIYYSGGSIYNPIVESWIPEFNQVYELTCAEQLIKNIIE